MSLLSRGREFISGKLQAAEGLTCVYTRGANSLTLAIWLGQTGFVSNIQDAARLERSDIDVLFLANDLILGGSATVPARGDRLTLSLNGSSVTLELMIPATGEPSWRYSDAGRTIIRLHCKRVV